MKLELRIHDSRNGLDYVLTDSYYIPAQKLPEHARLGLHGVAAEGVDGPLALREVGPQKYAAK